MNEEFGMRVKHAERCLENALAVLRRGMYHMSHTETEKMRSILQGALYEAETASLITKAMADEKYMDALRKRREESA